MTDFDIIQPNKNGENGNVDRDERGRVLPGSILNPNGRPKKSISITDEVRHMLDKYPIGKQKTYLQLIIARIFKKAIDNGDTTMLSLIWAYIDGKPNQNISVTPLEAEEYRKKLEKIHNELVDETTKVDEPNTSGVLTERSEGGPNINGGAERDLRVDSI